MTTREASTPDSPRHERVPSSGVSAEGLPVAGDGLDRSRTVGALVGLGFVWWGSDCDSCGNTTPDSMRCDCCGSTKRTRKLWIERTKGAT